MPDTSQRYFSSNISFRISFIITMDSVKFCDETVIERTEEFLHRVSKASPGRKDKAMQPLSSIRAVYSSLLVAGGLSISAGGALAASDLSESLELSLIGTSGPLQYTMIEQAGNENFANVYQGGSYNISRILQMGAGNRGDISQLGSANDARILQSGDYLDASIVQHGYMHTASIAQNGFGKEAEIIQHGAYGSANIQQLSNHHATPISITQISHGSAVVQVYQY
ncbi:hypothetical protein [uncultured Halomonas sp.]|uniref:hypothetical protein n=1 Tax=uncultured Halomonas sp. TaxID=173971 RepID=UPI0026145323|nr:hypothetical protein [uncultured Halomonas sp.]